MGRCKTTTTKDKLNCGQAISFPHQKFKKVNLATSTLRIKQNLVFPKNLHFHFLKSISKRPYGNPDEALCICNKQYLKSHRNLLSVAQCRGLKLRSKQGPHFEKKELSFQIRQNKLLRGPRQELKSALNHNFTDNLHYFDDDTGRTNTSGGPHVARGSRV